MGIFNFFRKNKKRSAEDPSVEQLLFANTVLEIIGPTVERFGFSLHSTTVTYTSTTIIYRNEKKYIKVNSTTFPTDYPYYYTIVFGEGSSDDFFEYDWNSVALWAIGRLIDPTAGIGSYDFPYGDQVRPNVESANADLLRYGISFLEGDLSYFYQCRAAVNQQRAPIKIHIQGQDGTYTVSDEPKSVEQKKKYS